MKIALLSLIAITLMVVSCKEEIKEEDKKTWVIEVTYIDNKVDTLEIVSTRKPELQISKGMGYLDSGDDFNTVACYVKTIKILK